MVSYYAVSRNQFGPVTKSPGNRGEKEQPTVRTIKYCAPELLKPVAGYRGKLLIRNLLNEGISESMASIKWLINLFRISNHDGRKIGADES